MKENKRYKIYAWKHNVLGIRNPRLAACPLMGSMFLDGYVSDRMTALSCVT